MNGQITLWQVVAAYAFALAGGWISTSLRLAHKPLCALISLAAGTLLGVTLFAILPESLSNSSWWAVVLATAEAAQWSLFSALCIHKVPEGLALGSLLIGAGLQRANALGWVAAVEATTLLGGVIGFFFLPRAPTFWLSLIMAHVGGGFFYLAAHAVLGEMMRHGKGLVVTSFSIGVALIGAFNICLRMLAL